MRAAWRVLRFGLWDRLGNTAQAVARFALARMREIRVEIEDERDELVAKVATLERLEREQREQERKGRT